MTSGANPYQLKTCPDCRRRFMSWGAHAEECPGPRQQIAPPPVRERECECPPGAFHDPWCPLVWPPKDAA